MICKMCEPDSGIYIELYVHLDLRYAFLIVHSHLKKINLNKSSINFEIDSNFCGCATSIFVGNTKTSTFLTVDLPSIPH